MFPEEVGRVNIGDLNAENGGLLPLSYGLIREPKLLTPSMLVHFSLYSLEICAAKILAKENFSSILRGALNIEPCGCLEPTTTNVRALFLSLL